MHDPRAISYCDTRRNNLALGLTKLVAEKPSCWAKLPLASRFAPASRGLSQISWKQRCIQKSPKDSQTDGWRDELHSPGSAHISTGQPFPASLPTGAAALTNEMETLSLKCNLINQRPDVSTNLDPDHLQKNILRSIPNLTGIFLLFQRTANTYINMILFQCRIAS